MSRLTSTMELIVVVFRKGVAVKVLRMSFGGLNKRERREKQRDPIKIEQTVLHWELKLESKESVNEKSVI